MTHPYCFFSFISLAETKLDRRMKRKEGECCILYEFVACCLFLSFSLLTDYAPFENNLEQGFLKQFSCDIIVEFFYLKQKAQRSQSKGVELYKIITIMSLRTAFHNDPFFGDVDLPQAMALEHHSRHGTRNRQISSRQQNNNREMEPFANPFSVMQTMMNNMGQMMSHMESRMNTFDFDPAAGHGVSFSSSTVMTMDGRNGGQPRIVQATSERLRGPEGLFFLSILLN